MKPRRRIVYFQRSDGRWAWREVCIANGKKTVGPLQGNGFASESAARKSFWSHAAVIADGAYVEQTEPTG